MRQKIYTGVCERCGEVFHTDNGRKRFCTQRCWLLTWNQPGASHAINGAGHGSKAIGDKLRGTGKGRYVKEGGRHQHRKVAEEMLGRPLRFGEEVHHVDRDGHNNSPINIVVYKSHSEHMQQGHPHG